MISIAPSPQSGPPHCRVAIEVAAQRKFGALLLLLHMPEGSGTEAAETLVRRRPFAESAGNLQQIFAIRGANPRFSRYWSSKSAANQQQTSSASRSARGWLPEWRSAPRARAKEIRIK